MTWLVIEDRGPAKWPRYLQTTDYIEAVRELSRLQHQYPRRCFQIGAIY